jgi:hypothetical protein
LKTTSFVCDAPLVRTADIRTAVTAKHNFTIGAFVRSGLVTADDVLL